LICTVLISFSPSILSSTPLFCLFFFTSPATTEFFSLSLHDALPIYAYLFLCFYNAKVDQNVLISIRRIDDTRHLILIAPDLPKIDRKSTRLNSSHVSISYAVFCLKKKNTQQQYDTPRSRPRAQHRYE